MNEYPDDIAVIKYRRWIIKLSNIVTAFVELTTVAITASTGISINTNALLL